LEQTGQLQFYLPHAQNNFSAMTLVVRTKGNPDAMLAPIRNEIRNLDADQAIFNIATMDQLIADSIAVRRLAMILLGLFAALALMLAVIGIYGVLSYTVSQRTQEIGIRMALGAQRQDIFKMIASQSLRLIITGIVIGLAIAAGATRLMTNLLFNVSAIDPMVFISLSLLLIVVALLAGLIPARRATAIDPMVALRNE
jgi:ABC-type antimicrobial peptide transport system permease subunit